MRVNVYAEEMTDRIEIISKEIDGETYYGLRIYLELPVTEGGRQVKGPFIHREGDDDSSAVTFWGKRDLQDTLRKALDALERFYEGKERAKLHDLLQLQPGTAVEIQCGSYKMSAAHYHSLQRELAALKEQNAQLEGKVETLIEENKMAWAQNDGLKLKITRFRQAVREI